MCKIINFHQLVIDAISNLLELVIEIGEHELYLDYAGYAITINYELEKCYYNSNTLLYIHNIYIEENITGISYEIESNSDIEYEILSNATIEDWSDDSFDVIDKFLESNF